MSLKINKIGDRGAKAFAKVILKTDIKEIYLQGNWITSEGAIPVCLAIE